MACLNRYFEAGYFVDDEYYENNCIEDLILLSASSSLIAQGLEAISLGLTTSTILQAESLKAASLALGSKTSFFISIPKFSTATFNSLSPISAEAFDPYDQIAVAKKISQLIHLNTQKDLEIEALKLASKEYLKAIDVLPMHGSREVLNV